MRSVILVPLVVTFAVHTLLPVAPAHAVKEYFPIEAPSTSQGSAWGLPIGPGVTPEEAIAHAYTMPAVRAALDVMAQRGYVAHPTYDQGGGFSTPPATVVCLSFSKPGVTPPADHLAAPLVLVLSYLDPFGQPVTEVTGGLAFASTITGRVLTAEDVLPYAGTDASYEVRGGGAGPLGGPRLAEPTILGATNSSGDVKFRRWAACTAVGSAASLVNTLLMPPVPQITLPRFAIQTVFIAAGCALGL